MRRAGSCDEFASSENDADRGGDAIVFYNEAKWKNRTTILDSRFIVKCFVPASSSQWGLTAPDLTRMTACALGSIQRKRLQIAIVIRRNAVEIWLLFCGKTRHGNAASVAMSSGRERKTGKRRK